MQDIGVSGNTVYPIADIALSRSQEARVSIMNNLLFGACPNGKVLEREDFSIRHRPSYYCIQDWTKQSKYFHIDGLRSSTT